MPSSGQTNVFLAVVAGLLFGGVAVLCLVWPNELRRWEINNTTRVYGHDHWITRWQERILNVWWIRLTGFIALMGVALLLLLVLFPKEW